MFRLIQTSDTRGDCTASYDVQLDKVYTVREFFETVLTQKADEWGAFYLMVRSKRLFWQNPSCEYKHGSRAGTTWANILMRYGDRKITEVKANGGWTNMDYYIWLDAPNTQPKASPQATEKEENEPMIHLKVEDYCHGCSDFEPNVDKQSIFSDDGFIGTETKITCEHAARCAVIVRHLKEKNENSEDKEGPET